MNLHLKKLTVTFLVETHYERSSASGSRVEGLGRTHFKFFKG